MPAPETETAPVPLFGPGDKPRAQRVAFDVTANGEEGLFLLHGKRLVSALIQVAPARIVVVGVSALRMHQTQPTAKPRQFPVLVRLDGQIAWRHECFWVILWALGYIDELGRPDTICDVKRAVSILRVNGSDGFLKNANLRPQSEILDAADLIFRYHWAVVDARVNQRDAPAGLDLNWLVGYMDQEWDDVSTDT